MDLNSLLSRREWSLAFAVKSPVEELLSFVARGRTG